jgi:hypothetical protein
MIAQWNSGSIMMVGEKREGKWFQIGSYKKKHIIIIIIIIIIIYLTANGPSPGGSGYNMYINLRNLSREGYMRSMQ